MTQHARPLVSSAAALGYALRSAPAGDDMRSTPRRLALALALALGAAACELNPAGPARDPGITATFALQTTRGVALPIVYDSGERRLDSRILVAAGRNFTIRTVESELDDGVVIGTLHHYSTGRVSTTGGTLSFSYNSTMWCLCFSGSITGILSGDTLTLTYDYRFLGEGDVWTDVYVKQ